MVQSHQDLSQWLLVVFQLVILIQRTPNSGIGTLLKVKSSIQHYQRTTHLAWPCSLLIIITAARTRKWKYIKNSVGKFHHWIFNQINIDSQKNHEYSCPFFGTFLHFYFQVELIFLTVFYFLKLWSPSNRFFVWLLVSFFYPWELNLVSGVTKKILGLVQIKAQLVKHNMELFIIFGCNIQEREVVFVHHSQKVQQQDKQV